MSDPAPSRRRWFSYSLRTFFVVLTVFCVWLGVQVKWVHGRQWARAWIKESDGYFENDIAAPWSIRLFDNGTRFIDLPFGRELTPSQTVKLRQLFPEAQILAFDHKKDQIELSADGLSWIDLSQPSTSRNPPASTDSDPFK